MTDQMDRLIAILEEDQPQYRGRSEDRVAQGIRQSGLTDAIRASGEQSSAEVANLSRMMGAALRDVAAQLSGMQDQLAGVAHLLAHPQSTAAMERFRRGCRALDRGWADEAVVELSEAKELDPYLAPVRASLGLALLRTSQPESAAHEFRLGLRYADDDEISLQLGCALLGTEAFLEAGLSAEAVELLDRAERQLPDNPDLALLRARLSGDGTGVPGALRRAPVLAVISVAADIPHALEAVEQWPIEPDSPVADADQLLRAYREIEPDQERWRNWAVTQEHLESPDPLVRAGAAGRVLSNLSDLGSHIAALATRETARVKSEHHHARSEYIARTRQLEAQRVTNARLRTRWLVAVIGALLLLVLAGGLLLVLIALIPNWAANISPGTSFSWGNLGKLLAGMACVMFLVPYLVFKSFAAARAGRDFASRIGKLQPLANPGEDLSDEDRSFVAKHEAAMRVSEDLRRKYPPRTVPWGSHTSEPQGG